MHLLRRKPVLLWFVAVMLRALIAVLDSIRQISDVTSDLDGGAFRRNARRLAQSSDSVTIPKTRKAFPAGTNTEKDPEIKFNDALGIPRGSIGGNDQKPTPFPIPPKSKLGPEVNPQPFTYDISPVSLCKDPDLFLIIYIHSNPKYYQRRKLVRETWGNPKHYKRAKVKMVFSVGRTPNEPIITQAINEESQLYGDILKSCFQDAYRNLSYKGVASMKWVTTHCKQATFVLKTDDDVFVNMFSLLKHLTDLSRVQRGTTGLLMCLVWSKMPVLRKGKWGIPVEMYPDSLYPPYCSGRGYTMTMDVAEALYKVSYHVPFFWVDDVYITGMLPKKLGLKHLTISKRYVEGKHVEECYTGPDWYQWLFSDIRDIDKFHTFWKSVVKKVNSSYIPKIPDNKIEPGLIALKPPAPFKKHPAKDKKAADSKKGKGKKKAEKIKAKKTVADGRG